MDIKITKVENGYIATSPSGRTNVFTALEDLFVNLLAQFEGLYPTFTGNSFGNVEIHRGEGEQPTK